MRRFFALLLMTSLMLTGCGLRGAKKTYPTIGTIERLDPAMDDIVALDATIELLRAN